MKKLFLLLFGAVLVAGTSFGYDFKKYQGVMFYKMSPDGNYLLSESEDGALIIYNRATNDTTIYAADEQSEYSYSLGMGNCVNNNGVVVGSMTDRDAAVWENGVWTALAMPEDMTKGTYTIANGITPDGKYICGSVSTADFGEGDSRTTYFPALWTKGEDGKYGVCEILPYPTKDFTGRSPQYITAINISSDGNTICGQVQSFDGFACYPIVYTKGADGKWSYMLYGLDEIVAEGTEFPAYPNYEPKYVDVSDYLTEADVAAYDSAYQVYEDSLNMYYNGEIASYPKQYPDQKDFLTENKDAYEAAIAKYNAENELYNDSLDTFESVYDDAITGKSFVYNSIGMSSNGKYLALVLESEDPDADPLDWMTSMLDTPVLIDLQNEGAITVSEGKKMTVLSVADDGTMTAGTPAIEYTRNAYVIPVGTTAPVKFEEWLATKCDTASIWLKENMRFEGVSYDYDKDTYEQIEVSVDTLVTGTMVANADLTVFCTYAYNYWAVEEEDAGWISCVIDISDPKNPTDGIANVLRKNKSGNVKVAAADGVISVDGDVANVFVYDMAGRKVAAGNGNASVAVSNGLYMVKAIGTDGNVVTKKVSVK